MYIQIHNVGHVRVQARLSARAEQTQRLQPECLLVGAPFADLVRLLVITTCLITAGLIKHMVARTRRPIRFLKLDRYVLWFWNTVRV